MNKLARVIQMAWFDAQMTKFKHAVYCKSSGLHTMNKALQILLLCIYHGTAFSQVVLPDKNRFDLLASNIKGAIKQTSAQYNDDGQIVAWKEAYIQPSDGCIEYYSFYRSDAGKFERTASEALFGDKIYLLSSKGLFLPRHVVNDSDGGFVNNVLTVLTVQEFAKPRLESAQKILDLPGIDSNPMLLAKAYDVQRLLNVTEVLKKGELVFEEAGRQYVATMDRTGLLTSVKISDEGHLRLQIRNEEIPSIHIEPPLQLFIDKDGKETYYQPSNFIARHVTTSSLGIVYVKTPDGYFVRDLVKGSPASKTDIKIGDQIISTDNVEVKQLDNASFDKLFSSTEVINLKIKHASGKIAEYTLQKSLPSTW